ncbi:hypothetical protein AA0473_0296 [Acetobacter orleanensis NRIC 0473]|nr:hypothetical protein AA0473_0296 [Acetobacter orleanensis NRIC 0473]
MLSPAKTFASGTDLKNVGWYEAAANRFSRFVDSHHSSDACPVGKEKGSDIPAVIGRRVFSRKISRKIYSVSFWCTLPWKHPPQLCLP